MAFEPTGDYHAQPHLLIARLNVDGSKDDSFNCHLAGDANLRLTTVAVQRNGGIWIGGQFTKVNSVARHNLTRLNADGSLDLSFDPQSVIPGTNHYVEELQVQPDDKLLVSGAWSSPPPEPETTPSEFAR